VKFVEERGIGRQVSFDEGPRLLVARSPADEAMSSQHAPRVRVGDEHRATGGVEQDRVHGLGAEAGNAEQVAAQRGQWLAAQPLPAPEP